VLKRKSRKVINPLSVALRLAARTLRNSKSALGAQNPNIRMYSRVDI
jgi:hypothetical protein